MADQLPGPESIEVPEGFNAQDLISILPAGAFQSSEGQKEPVEDNQPGSENSQEPASERPVQSDPPINESAFILAFLGWDSFDGAANMAGCSACFRRLGFWMYKPKATEDGSSHDPLDAANEHMEYCPWINGETQSGTGKPSEKPEGLRSGWELLAQALKVKHLRQTRSSTPMGSRAGSEAPSMDDPEIDEPNDVAKKAKDREWWAKIRRMRQVLNVKSPKRKPAAQ